MGGEVASQAEYGGGFFVGEPGLGLGGVLRMCSSTECEERFWRLTFLVVGSLCLARIGVLLLRSRQGMGLQQRRTSVSERWFG